MMNLILEASFEQHATCVLSIYIYIYILPYPSPDGGSLRLLEKVTVRCSCRNINQTPEAELRTQPDTDVSRWKSCFVPVCIIYFEPKIDFLVFFCIISVRDLNFVSSKLRKVGSIR